MSDILYEMANLVKDETGVDHVLFVSPKGNAKHGCRIKVCNSLGKMNPDDTFSISVPDLSIHGDTYLTAKELNRILSWILLNKNTILDYWNSKINTTQMVKRLEKI